MREILFRGKRVDNGEWVYGQTVFQFLDSFYMPAQNLQCTVTRSLNPVGNISVIKCNRGNYFFKVQPETVGQYTGLTDKNGKKIFEGDILKVKQLGEMGVRTCAIYFGEYIDADIVLENYRCIGFYLKVVDECCSIGALLDSDFEFEIIGNIYDNPELLEVGE